MKARDRRLNAIVAMAWPHLPSSLLKTSSNLAKIRFGIIGYTLLVVAIPINAVIEKTPAQFAEAAFSWAVPGAVVSLLAGYAILIGRAMQSAPRFIAALQSLVPDEADAIADHWRARGAGDVVAPWIRTKGGIINGLARRFTRSLRIVP